MIVRESHQQRNDLCSKNLAQWRGFEKRPQQISQLFLGFRKSRRKRFLIFCEIIDFHDKQLTEGQSDVEMDWSPYLIKTSLLDRNKSCKVLNHCAGSTRFELEGSGLSPPANMSRSFSPYENYSPRQYRTSRRMPSVRNPTRM